MNLQTEFTRTEIENYYAGRAPKLRRLGKEWRGPCPVHEGKGDNFAVNPETGACFCHSRCGRGWDIVALERELSGCSFQEAVARISSRPPEDNPPAGRKLAATYRYEDENGRTLFEVLRYSPKSFRQRRPRADGGWEWNLDGVRRVLYGLPAILKASRGVSIYVVEGEKDVETLRRHGFTATCNPGGAGKWRDEYAETLRGRPVIVIGDADAPGRSHAAAVTRSLFKVAGAVWTLELPAKDVTEFFERGRSAADFLGLCIDHSVEVRNESDIPTLAPVLPMPLRETEPAEPPPALPSIVWEGFAGEYLAAVENCTEAPPEFHLGSLMAAAGALLGRDIYTESPHPLYANFYTALVGATGMGRKTTAVRFATRLAQEAGAKLGIPLKTLYGIASVEGLANAMVDDDRSNPARIFAVEDEFRSLIAKGSQKAVSNLIPRLTELYNHLPSFEVNTRTDRIRVENFFLTVVAASTREWFGDSLTDLDVSGGFLNRWCLFCGSPTRPIPRPDPVSAIRWNGLVESLAERVRAALRTPCGNRELSLAAGERFDRFYNDFWRRSLNGGQVAEATSRIHSHALKFALVYSVLDGHTRIEDHDMKRGLAVAEYCAASASNLLEAVGMSRGSRLERRVLEQLQDGTLGTTELMRKLRVPAKDLHRTLNDLHSMGLVRLNRQTGTGGRSRIDVGLVA